MCIQYSYSCWFPGGPLTYAPTLVLGNLDFPSLVCRLVGAKHVRVRDDRGHFMMLLCGI